jgi:hypothetical protein
LSARKRNIFLLLTGGAQRELEALAYEIVVSDEGSRRSAGDTKSYISTQSSMASADDFPSPGREGPRHMHDQDQDHDQDDIFDEDDDEW